MICAKCGNQFPSRVEIDGKVKVLTKRKNCLECQPYLDRAAFLEKSRLPEHGNCKICGRLFKRRKTGGKTCRACLSRRRRQSCLGKLKKELVDYKGGACQLCGYNKCLRALCFHHTDPSQKDLKIANYCYSGSASIQRLKDEVDKCVLLCHNCHMEVHDGQSSLSECS